MKKDIEWLKGEIKNFQKGENMFTAEFNAGVQQALEYVQELIDQLDEPETLSEKWIENHTASADTISYYSDENVPVVTVEKLKNLLVPKQDNGFVVFEKDKLDEEVQRMIDETYEAMNEKPVIPQFVADYIEKWKYETLIMHEWFTFDHDDQDEDRVSKWLYNNTIEENRRREYLLIDAIRNGYEVEKEKLYHVVNKENYFLLRKYDGFVGILHALTAMSRDKYRKDTRFMLTEQEIKDYDERYWAFAQEVTQ